MPQTACACPGGWSTGGLTGHPASPCCAGRGHTSPAGSTGQACMHAALQCCCSLKTGKPDIYSMQPWHGFQQKQGRLRKAVADMQHLTGRLQAWH